MNRLGSAKAVCFTATAKPSSARTFYAEVLGLRFVEETPFALVFDANGTTLRVQKVAAVTPAQYTVLGWEVDDIRWVTRALRGGMSSAPPVRGDGPGRGRPLDIAIRRAGGMVRGSRRQHAVANAAWSIGLT